MFSTETKCGTTDELTTVIANDYPGFEPQQIEQQIINCNETAVVRINYKRKIITYTFDKGSSKNFNIVCEDAFTPESKFSTHTTILESIL